ncbi:transposable element Tcb1 transposase [Trichonephila clavipes]|nr:transposable element Tcb1 transposase [Trichonephila clavipes]
MNGGHGQRNGTILCLLTNPVSAGNTTVVRFEFRDTVVNEVLETVVLPYIQRLPSALFQQDYARPQVLRNVQEFFTHQIELLPWATCSPDLSSIEYVWSMLAQQLALGTPSANTPDQLWQYEEAA